MKTNTLAIALASMLVGGVAVAAFQHSRSVADGLPQAGATDAIAAGLDADASNAIGVTPQLAYAQVLAVEPILEKQARYGTVIASEPINETVSQSTPRQVCQDVVVSERLPERDGNKGGAVAGAVIGGLLGSQVGSGNGRKLATVAGAVGGGFAGREIDRRHVGGRQVERVESQCRTVEDVSQSTRVVAYNVRYRNEDGSIGSLRSQNKPGDRIALGNADVPVGYNVTYLLDGAQHTVRMDDRPGERLPVVDGQVVLQTASLDGNGARR